MKMLLDCHLNFQKSGARRIQENPVSDPSMKNHIETLRVLQIAKEQKETQCFDLTLKIEALEAAIDLWRRAKRVLARKKNVIRDASLKLSQRISCEIRMLQEKQNEQTEKEKVEKN